MAFELNLLPTQLGPSRMSRNPFKPDGPEVPHQPREMGAEEVAAIQRVLAQYKVVLDEEGSGVANLSGATVGFHGLNLEGDMVKVSGDLSVAAEFLFALASAGNLQLVGDDEEGVVVTELAYARSQNLPEGPEGPFVYIATATNLAKHFAGAKAEAEVYARSVT